MNRLIRLVLDLMPPELRQLTVAAGLDVEATCRLQPLAELFALARKNRGWSSPRAAKATGARRRTVDAAESANPARIVPDELIAYSARLGTLHLLGEWVSANPRLAGDLGFPTEDSILSRGRMILAEDARPAALLPSTLSSLAPRRFEAPAGFSDHLDPDRAEARLSGLMPPLPDQDPTVPNPDAPSAASLLQQLPAQPAAPATYEFHLSLKHVSPRIWRRIRVPNTLSFARFHHVIQDAMGWTDTHLHAFSWRDLEIGRPNPDWHRPLLDEARISLAHLGLRTRARLAYRYDFGDDWGHELRLERILPLDPDTPTLVCLEGEGACPPENCGGPFGYTELLRAVDNPSSPTARELLEWVSPDWKPLPFDLEAANDRLARLAAKWNRNRARSRKRSHPAP